MAGACSGGCGSYFWRVFLVMTNGNCTQDGFVLSPKSGPCIGRGDKRRGRYDACRVASRNEHCVEGSGEHYATVECRVAMIGRARAAAREVATRFNVTIRTAERNQPWHERRSLATIALKSRSTRPPQCGAPYSPPCAARSQVSATSTAVPNGFLLSMCRESYAGYVKTSCMPSQVLLWPGQRSRT